MSSTKIIIAAIVATLSSACAVHTQPATTIDADGRVWVRLSTADPLLDEVAVHASGAGCRLVGDPSESFDGAIEVYCGTEKIRIVQNIKWLGFRCSTLAGDECGHLVLAITSDHRKVTPTRSSGWGI